MSTKTTETRGTLARLAAEEHKRLADELAEVDERLEVIKEERAAKAEEQRGILYVLRHLEPDNEEWAPKAYKTKTKPGPKSHPWNVSEEKVSTLEEWLKTHAKDNGLADGFTYTLLRGRIDKDPEVQLAGETIRRAINALTDRGVLRLDRLGRGGGKVYKLTEEVD